MNKEIINKWKYFTVTRWFNSQVRVQTYTKLYIHCSNSHTGAKTWLGLSPAACEFRHPFHINFPKISYQTHHKFHLKKAEIFLCLLSDGCYHQTQLWHLKTLFWIYLPPNCCNLFSMKMIFIPPWYLSSALLFITNCATAPSLPVSQPYFGQLNKSCLLCSAVTIPHNPLDVLQPESISGARGVSIIYMQFQLCLSSALKNGINTMAALQPIPHPIHRSASALPTCIIPCQPGTIIACSSLALFN